MGGFLQIEGVRGEGVPTGKSEIEIFDITFPSGGKVNVRERDAVKKLEVMINTANNTGQNRLTVSVAKPTMAVLVGLLLPAIQRLRETHKPLKILIIIPSSNRRSSTSQKFEMKDCIITDYKSNASGGEISFNFAEIKSSPGLVRFEVTGHTFG